MFPASIQALMVNEFHGLTDLEFNAKGAPPVYITGDTWLVNFDVDVTSNKWIVLEGGFALAAITLVCVSGAYTALECLKH